MTVGSFKAKYETICVECHHRIPVGAQAWFRKGQTGYWCEECEKIRSEPAQDAGAKQESPKVPDWERGHKENMDSARQTRDVLANLTVAIISLRDAILKKEVEKR